MGVNNTVNQLEFLAITYNLLKAHKNTYKVTIDFVLFCFSLVEKLD